MFTESYSGPASTALAPKPLVPGRSQFRSASSGYHQHPRKSSSTSSLDISCNVSTAQAYSLLSSSSADDDHHHHGPEGLLISGIRAALTNMEYNRATQRLTGSIAVRDLSSSGAPQVEVAVQYSVDGGCRWAETTAHLLFVHADLQFMQQQCTDLDVYGFSLRAGKNTIAQAGQTMHLRVVVRDSAASLSETLFVDDNRGAYYECKGVVHSPRSSTGDGSFVLRL